MAPLPEIERRLRARLDAVGAAPRAELLHVLTLPDFNRADRIGEFWGKPKTQTFAELLIDCEEDRVLRAVLVGMLRGTAMAWAPQLRKTQAWISTSVFFGAPSTQTASSGPITG